MNRKYILSVVCCITLSFGASEGRAQPSVEGEWGPLLDWPLQCIHGILLKTGKVLCIDNPEQNGSAMARLYDPVSDVISFQGALDFAPSGNLYYGSHRTGTILRITPDGEASLFDDIGTRSMAVDRFGNVFTLGAGSINRFDCENASTKRVLAEGFRVSALNVLAVSADGRTLYFAENGTNIYAIDPEKGVASLIANFTFGSPHGMTVFEPQRASDIFVDQRVDLRDFAELVNCWNDPGLGEKLCGCRPTDLNSDGQVGLPDFLQLIKNLQGPEENA